MKAQGIPPRPVETSVRRDLAVVLAGLFLLVMLAWAYLIRLAATMSAHGATSMSHSAVWSPAETGWLAVMWAIMMVAMMVPSGAPAILLFVRHTRRHPGEMAGPAAAFTLGYILAWAAFGVLAALAQSALHSRGLLSPAMRSVSPVLGGGLLIAAGIYQWLPVKARCLSRCRSPMSDFSPAALVAGLRHGLVCVQCCWLLMLLLFVAGVMNLVWIGAIAGLVLVERVVPGGPAIGMLTGAGLAAWGVWVMVGP
jgi:predicted metal-binding membrane protein